MANQEYYFLGIDLTDRQAMISYFTEDMKEPETAAASSDAGLPAFPLALALKKGTDQWYMGEEAKKLAKEGDAFLFTGLFSGALSGDTITAGEASFPAEKLLTRYLQLLIAFTGLTPEEADQVRLAVVVDHVSRFTSELFGRMLPELGIEKEHFLLMDRKCAFCYFALSQKDPLWTHDVLLFDYRRTGLRYMQLKRMTKVRPQLVSITESRKYAISEDKDQEFLQVLKTALEGQSVSSVYLVGEEFDGDWMKTSLTYLCRGRRAFIGQNLYTKGACYAAIIMEYPQIWPFIYLGENDMKFTLAMQMRDKDRTGTVDLIRAGTNVEHAFFSCEAIPEGNVELEIIKKVPGSREDLHETLHPEGFPQRGKRMTRLKISAKALSDSSIDLEIQDMGFGDFCRSSQKTWHFTVTL